MTEFTVYSLTDKKLLRRGVAPEPDIQAGEGEAVILGWGDLDIQEVDDSGAEPVFVDRPRAEIEAREVAEAWARLRAKRNTLLDRTDGTQAPDSPADTAAWKTYRQALRDLPQNTADPRDVHWPEPPAKW